MGFNSFRTNFIIRSLLLTASIFGLSYLWYYTELTMTLILAGLLVLFQIVAMIFYVDRTNRVLNNFLESIRYSDFTRTFQIESTDSSFDKLKKSFNEVIEDFQAVRAEKDQGGQRPGDRHWRPGFPSRFISGCRGGRSYWIGGL